MCGVWRVCGGLPPTALEAPRPPSMLPPPPPPPKVLAAGWPPKDVAAEVGLDHMDDPVGVGAAPNDEPA